MITSLVKTTARTTAGAVRLASKPGVWLTRTLVAAVFKPSQPQGRPEPPAPTTPSPPPTRRRAAPKAKPTSRSRSRSRPAPKRPTRAAAAAPAGVPARDVPPPLAPEPHHELNTPVGEPDPTEWPDPYDRRPDPRDPQPDGATSFGEAPHTPTGAVSTSEPHPDQDPEAVRSKAPRRDNLDE